jgi:Uma2 family endonuclease
MTQALSRQPDTKARRKKISYDEFLKLYMNGEHLEWVKGEVVEMSPVTKEHEDERGLLYTIIREYALINRCGEVSGEPYNMKIGYGLPGRAPDILFVANANLTRMHNDYLDGPADLVVEIISPGSRTIDRKLKFSEYEQGGVREYWIIDPKRKEADFYVRDDNGKYQSVAADNDGIYRSTVLNGFWFQTGWLWQRPLPTLLDVLRAWKVI